MSPVATSAKRINIVLIAAIGENHVIGNKGQLPWHLKSDLAHFKRLTLGKPVVMGRKTYESIGKPLKDRPNIVMTRDLGLVVPGGILATSLDAALGMARQEAERLGVGDIMIIGGSDVFAATMPKAARLEITHVHMSPEGDVYFPTIDPTQWLETARYHYPAGPGDDASFDTVTYVPR